MGCPEYTERGIYTCYACKDGICNGESYYKIGALYFHRECLMDSYDKDELLRLIKGQPKTASNYSLVFIGEKDEK